MNRRQFGGSLLGLTGSVLIGRRHSLTPRQESLRVDGARLLRRLNELAEFGKNPQGGVSRVAYSAADLEARDYVLGLMTDAQLDPAIDAAGNIIGRRTGSESGLPPLMFGSHIDSVPEGGNYDGPLGSLGAIEVAQTLAEQGRVTRHPLEVIVFQNEEGGKTGSRVMSGELEERELDLVTHSGKTIGEGIAFIGGDPTRLESARRRPADVAAFVELHVEQGAILEHEAIDIGVVEGIVGIQRWNVTVEGVANHAGTTPMDIRQDALLAAARFIDAVNRVVRSIPGRQVGTVGMISASPGAPNVVPGRVAASLEIRDLAMDKIEQVYQQIRAEADRIGRDTGTAFGLDEFYVSGAAPTDARLQGMVQQSAAELGLSALRMPSGAGHDAQSVAKFAPAGMIFVPSVGGISHSPQEFTRPEDVVNGVNVLLHTLLKMDLIAW
jgi:N-carbamoyl-L-amino-acid hydrolase